MIQNMLILRKMGIRMMKIKKIIFLFLAIDILAIFILTLLGEYLWILNSQIAILSSLAVTLGSYYGYKKNIEKRVEHHHNFDDNYDEIDKMDDQFDLYSPDVLETEVKEEMTKDEIKEEISKNKAALKKNNVKNIYKSFGAASSFYRLGGYIVLILGFFFLNNNGYLHIFSYLTGFIIVPLLALAFSAQKWKIESL
jgi:hypothetical protein